jgi:PleD family two-component response regulator
MKALIVDDMSTNGIVLKHIMKKVCETIPDMRTDPVQALKDCEHNQYDLIIIDHYMPGLNGCEFAAAVRKIDGYVNVPILMVTSAEAVEVCVEAFKSGVTDFLSKPVQIDEFRMRVALAISSGHDVKNHHAA